MEKERRNVMQDKKILPPTYLFAAIVLMVAFHFFIPGLRLIPFPWNLAGLIPFGLGLGVILLVDSMLKKHNTTVKPFEKSTTLLTTGLFRISRHPMYVGFVVLLVGIAIFMGSVTPYAIVVVFALLMDVVFIRSEETMLHETFGENWMAYKRHVRRWL
jgi:protein-S-isoprenylcysteine O-methyltransferase Ste14